VTGDFVSALGGLDALITPTVPTVAVPIGQETVDIGGAEFELRPTYTRFTSPVSVTGLPSISVPCGFSSSGLPIGMQLIGNFFDEEALLSLAHAYESATDWHKRRPPVD
jgi:aspartyl-tRNA(Asn)/glutamyl-tRNA(Gln) amidotransferase subunit A